MKKFRCNFSFITRYSLKFTVCSLLIVKSLVTRCKIRLLLVAEVARFKISLVTCCKNHSLVVAKFARYSFQKLLVTKSHSLLVAEVARCKKTLFTYCKNSLVTRYEKNPVN